MILEDPILGTAYRIQPGERGVHNGLLAGWARYGLGWVLLFLASLMLMVRKITITRTSLTAKVGASVLILEVIGHGLTHTNFITLGDVVGWCYLGFALVFVGIPMLASKDDLAPPELVREQASERR
jgi:hypothetical protein